MWIMTTGGYVSIVAKGGKDVLMVRSRDRESLKQFCIGAGIPANAIVTGKGTDYPHRVYSNREEVAKFLLAEMEWLQYRNFKDEAKVSRGPEYANFLSKVWGASLALEDVVFKKWQLGWDDDSTFAWETDEINEKHLTAKKNLGYDGSKKRNGKNRRNRNRKGH